MGILENKLEMKQLLEKVEKLLMETRFDIDKVREIYEETMLENAMSGLINPEGEKVLSYVEEFMRNAMFLLELGSEPDARFQVEVARSIMVSSSSPASATTTTTIMR